MDPAPIFDCGVGGTVFISICKLNDGYEIIFKEGSVFGHSSDCEGEFNAAHTHDFDCIFTRVFTNFVQFGMPIILEQLEPEEASCYDGNTVYRSNYVKQTCTVACTVFNPMPITRFYPCGDGDACCEHKEIWCKTKEGYFRSVESIFENSGACEGVQIPDDCDLYTGLPRKEVCTARSCNEFSIH